MLLKTGQNGHITIIQYRAAVSASVGSASLLLFGGSKVSCLRVGRGRQGHQRGKEPNDPNDVASSGT